jgi:hypothetical protein
MINITPPNISVTLGSSPITDKVVSLDVAKTTIIQGIINLIPSHGLTIRPGDIVTLNLPFASSLIIQTYSNNQIVCGCLLSTYLDAVPDEPDVQVSEYLPLALSKILQARGIPPDKIQVNIPVNLGSKPTYGSDPVEIANACGYHLYSKKSGEISLSPMAAPDTSIGSFALEDLANTPDTGSNRPLTANRVISTGILTKVKEKDLEYKLTSKTPVRGGYRTTTREYKVRRDTIIETETVKEPKSQISSFSANYESNKSSPGKLLNSFYYTSRTPDIESSKTVVTTKVDRDGNIVKRSSITTGVAAKGLSAFYSAWASAEVPPPPDPAEETEDTSGVPLFNPQTGASLGGDYNYNPATTLDSSESALTIRKPSGLFETVDLEIIEESWDWDIGDTQKTLTNPNSTFVKFKSQKGSVYYTRVKYLPIGAILPEAGNPLFGFQTPTTESRPNYRDPKPLVIAEKETISYQLDEAGEWYADRLLEQAVGVRNAQEPLDAMKSVQFPAGDLNSYATDRTNVALNVATQLTPAVPEYIQASPPGKPSVDDKVSYDLTRDYRFEISLADSDILDRSIQISPSSFSPNIKAIVDYSKYQAMSIKGQNMEIQVDLPLSGLTFDIPTGSVVELESKKYIIQKTKATVSLSSGILSLTLWPY